MEDDIELKVRSAVASLEGETARIVVVTDYGRITLQMHRIVLGALAGTIARALFPRTGEDVPALAGDEPPNVPTQPETEEPENEAGAAFGGVENVPSQPEASEPEGEPLPEFDMLWPEVGESAAASASGEPQDTQAQQPEGDEFVTFADDEPPDIPTQPDAREPEEEADATIAGDPIAGDEPENIPTQPEAQEPEGEPVAASIGDEPPTIPTPSGSPKGASRKPIRHSPRRKNR